MARKRIAVMVASIDREYQRDFASGLAVAGAQNDADICIFNSQGHMNVDIYTNGTGESIIYDLPAMCDFDGIISMQATLGNEETQQKVRQVLERMKGKPHVSIDVPMEDAVTILFDDQISMEEITEHLINEHGVRRVAFVGGPLDSVVTQARLEACQKALANHGLTIEEGMLFDGEWTRVGGKRAAERILASGGELPDAVICANDDMALSVIECFNEQGINVPKDVRVTGFDALREAVMRGVTTICRPIDRSAKKAIEVLCRWLDGEKPERNTITLSTIPIYGVTCGCVQTQEHMSEKLQVLGTERWNMETIMTRVSMFSGAMASVGDEKEAKERIHEFREAWGIKQLYMCVDPAICREWEGTQEENEFPEQMLLLYGAREEKKYRTQLFPTADLIPVLQEMRKSPLCLAFNPLYYRDRNFGYVAMDLGSGTGSALYSVLMLLNGALMSLYLQTSIKRSASTIEKMAIQDVMTGIQNRRGYMKQAPAIMEQARREGKIFVILSADMDHMKDINDQYGHLTGDEAICRMGQAVRVVEGQGITPVHISGDEFLAYGIVDTMDRARSLPAIVSEELERINREDPWICDLSVSLGVYAAIPGPEDGIDGFMTRADRAMYAEKNRRKSQK